MKACNVSFQSSLAGLFILNRTARCQNALQLEINLVIFGNPPAEIRDYLSHLNEGVLFLIGVWSTYVLLRVSKTKMTVIQLYKRAFLQPLFRHL